MVSQGKDTFLSSEESMTTENAARAHSRPAACLLQKYQNILINQLLNPTCPLKLVPLNTCSKLAQRTITQFSSLKYAIPCVWIFSEKKRNKQKYHTSQLENKKKGIITYLHSVTLKFILQWLCESLHKAQLQEKGGGDQRGQLS